MSTNHSFSISKQMQLVFVHVEMDDPDTGKPVAEYFGVEENAPKVLFLCALTAVSLGLKYLSRF